MFELPAYSRNKFRTLIAIIRRIANWPTAVGLRLFRRRPGLRLLAFRNGLNVICRGATRDWDVVHELFFAGSYGHAIEYLREQPGSPQVIDLGGNIGLFSLLAASAHGQARVIAFEPGPPNRRLFEMNRLGNPRLSDRIEIRPEAVGGVARTAEWVFDEENPGGSGLYAAGAAAGHPVQVVTLAEVVASLPGSIALLKVDVEGAEYEIVRQTPGHIWQRIEAVSIELHGDPEQSMTQQDLLQIMERYGFRTRAESVCSYFLSR